MASKHQSRIRLVAIGLVCTLALLCGCKSTGHVPVTSQVNSQIVSATSETSAPNTATFTLAYTANDSLNPYLAQTKTNQELAGLLYDGLVVLNRSFEAEYRLAKSVEMKGEQVVITLEDAWFSDGSAVTPQDVLVSLEAAQTAQNLSYPKDFEKITDKAVTGKKELTLNLENEDPYFVNFLDFPIFKAGTDEHQNDDNKDLPPIGSGRYVFHEKSGEYWLTANPKWIGGSIGIQRVELLNLPDDDAIDHACQVGTVDWCYSDLSDNDFPNMNGISQTITLANLVYLGANTKVGLMANRELRMGVSAAVNREDIVKTAYFEMAEPASGPYPKTFEAAVGLQSILPTPQTETAEEFFKKAGFEKVNKKGYRTNGNVSLELKLIYNKENRARASLARLVASHLKAVGCKVNLQGMSFAQYTAAIQYAQYDLYVGEVQIPDNFDLYPLLTAGGLITPDTSEPKEKSEPKEESSPNQADTPLPNPDGEEGEPLITADLAAYRYHNGKGSFTEMLSCVNQQLPIIPLCHRKGMLVYANTVEGEPYPLAGEPFHGLEQCQIKSVQ